MEENQEKSERKGPGRLLLILGVLACAAIAALAFFLWGELEGLLFPASAYCRHPSWEDGVCTVCGTHCEHDRWKNGVCTRCGLRCEHPNWEDGVCTVCGTRCEHPSWEDGACTVCGVTCEHGFWEDGVCAICGAACEHPSWKDGVCTVCGFVCPHEEHDPDSARCLLCGEQTNHSYFDGHCVGCGREPFVTDFALPEYYYDEAEHQGTTLYDRFPYGGYEQMLRLYLPYGYDETKQYNLIILLHGHNGDISNNIDNEFYTAAGAMRACQLYDHMIEDHLCEPFIVATVYTGLFSENGHMPLGKEIHDGLLPYLAEHYATYAASGKPRDLRAARMHFAIGGQSNGGLFAWYSGMICNFDYIANYICMSTGPESVSRLVGPVVQAYEKKGVGFGVFYDGAGAWEAKKLNTEPPFHELVELASSLTEGKNAFYHEVDHEHGWTTWFACYYNGLQLVFPAVESEAAK